MGLATGAVLQYGDYRFAEGEAELSIMRAGMKNDAGIIWAYLETWRISGLLLNPNGNPATATQRILALEAAFSVEGRDLRLYINGSQSAHSLLSGATYGGVRISKPLEFPESKGAEHVTYRTFSVELSGMRLTGFAGTQVVAFEETVSFSGGGPLYGFIETLAGPPVKQFLRKQTVFKATQEGRISGLSGYPAVPPPLFPSAQIAAPLTSYSSARLIDGAAADWPFSYQYQFESASALSGRPNQRPGG